MVACVVPLFNFICYFSVSVSVSFFCHLSLRHSTAHTWHMHSHYDQKAHRNTVYLFVCVLWDARDFNVIDFLLSFFLYKHECVSAVLFCLICRVCLCVCVIISYLFYSLAFVRVVALSPLMPFVRRRHSFFFCLNIKRLIFIANVCYDVT